MNKLFTKIAGLTLGLAMAIGVGVAIGEEQAQPTGATISTSGSITTVTDEVYDFTTVSSISSYSGWSSNITADNSSYLLPSNGQYLIFDNLIPANTHLYSNSVTVSVSGGTFGGTSNTFKIKAEILDSSNNSLANVSSSSISNATATTYRINGSALTPSAANKSKVKKT